MSGLLRALLTHALPLLALAGAGLSGVACGADTCAGGCDGEPERSVRSSPPKELLADLEATERPVRFLANTSPGAGLLHAPDSTKEAAPRARELAPGDCRTLSSEGACRGYDAQKYALSAELDWSRKKLVASERLELKLNDRSRGVVDLDSAVEVSRVHARGEDLPYSVDTENGMLRVDLTSLARRGCQVAFSVDYEASTSLGFHMPAPERVDPVQGRAAFTFSEPDTGKNWLVAKHEPSDRAAFTVDARLDRADDLVANGRRVRDERCGNRRCVRYELNAPTPAYVMAFAAGDLVHHDAQPGAVPLSVWHRRGLAVDANAFIRETERTMSVFTELLGAYPWQEYSIVILPALPAAGMENTTITFLSENGATMPESWVMGHELAHQWFGNWVTIETFDDLWVKEGMATLLSVEADRVRLDEANTGSLLGDFFMFDPGDAIVDRDLSVGAKYTSGVYQRAAWLLTQIRANVGERAFWSSLRQVLRDDALGSIRSDAFLQSFAPALNPSEMERALNSLELHTAAEVTYDLAEGPGGPSVTMTLLDPEGSMIAPAAATVVDASGRAKTFEIPEGTAQTFDVPSGGYFAPDERAVHVMLSADGFGDVALPTATPALRAFGRRSPSHQRAALWLAPNFPQDPAAAESLYRRLDSNMARVSADWQVCLAVQALPPDESPAAWIEEFAPHLRAEHEGMLDPSRGACGVVLATEVFGDEFTSLTNDMTAETQSRLIYVMSYDFGAARTFELLQDVVRRPISLVVRGLALTRLAWQLVYEGDYSAVDAGDYDAWSALFREALPHDSDRYTLRIMAQALAALGDEQAVPLLADTLLRLKFRARDQERIICAAHTASEGHPDAWLDFQTALEPWTQFAPGAQAFLEDPSTCP